ncbi:MAG: 23S rRNA (pseudouridine(1915)-N(3))-methyltransferase RlmH [Defluviitaleaceae bacterium]|nr:23S rRNA (pseudouridine(1915)-N(3))-methyltransferase RlmH [Defluviitaleaceae bacterium]
MKTNIICIGKLKENYLNEANAEYSKRLKRFTELNIIEIQSEKIYENISQKEEDIIKNKEGEKIIEKSLKIKDTVFFPLFPYGKMLDSYEFANLLEKNPKHTFIIGGTLGLSKDVLNIGKNISFSKLTFSHQIMRMILLEQIFRACKIVNNEKYHR